MCARRKGGRERGSKVIVEGRYYPLSGEVTTREEGRGVRVGRMN